uniref:Uncharacterized protein n=1 Tax=Ciona intestinalis TaxID=7719 RepID=H2XPS6_CIOIN
MSNVAYTFLCFAVLLKSVRTHVYFYYFNIVSCFVPNLSVTLMDRYIKFK